MCLVEVSLTACRQHCYEAAHSHTAFRTDTQRQTRQQQIANMQWPQQRCSMQVLAALHDLGGQGPVDGAQQWRQQQFPAV
jgi:hypothetical protein